MLCHIIQNIHAMQFYFSTCTCCIIIATLRLLTYACCTQLCAWSCEVYPIQVGTCMTFMCYIKPNHWMTGKRNIGSTQVTRSAVAKADLCIVQVTCKTQLETFQIKSLPPKHIGIWMVLFQCGEKRTCRDFGSLSHLHDLRSACHPLITPAARLEWYTLWVIFDIAHPIARYYARKLNTVG